MTGPIETAYVSILPDVDASKFSKEVNAKIDSALKGVGQQAAKSFGAVEEEAGQAGRSIASDLDKAAVNAKSALGKIGTAADTESSQVSHAFDGAGAAIETDITKGSTGAKEELGEIPVQAKESAAKTKAAFAGTGEVIAKEAAQGRSALGSLKGALIGVGALSAAYAGFSFLKEGTLDAEESASGLRVVSNLIKQAGDQADLTVKKVAAFATDQSFKIGVDDDDILAAGKNLISLKGITEDTFERASAAGADLAAVLGKGLAPTTKSLAKALGDPTKAAGALAKANVFLTDTQKENIQALVDAGKVDEARGKILDLVDGKVQGSAEKSATATSKIGTAFAELRENVGGAVTGLLNKIAPALVGFFTKLQDNAPAIKNAFGNIAATLTPVIAGIGDAIKAAIPVISKLIDGAVKAFDTLKPSIAAAADVIALLAPKIGALIAVVAPLVAGLAAVAVVVISKILPPFLNFAGPVLGAVIDAITSTITALTDFFSSASSPELIALGVAIGAIAVAMGAAAAATAFWSALIKINMAVSKAFAAVQAAVNAVMSANPIGLVVIAIAALVAGLIIAYQRSEKFRAIVDAVGSVLKGVFLASLNGVKAAIGFVIDFVQKMGDKLLFILGPIGAIIYAFRHWDEIKAIVGNVIDSVVGFFTGLPGKIGAALDSVWNAIKNFTIKVVLAIGNWEISMIAKFKNLFVSLVNSVQNGVTRIVDFFESLPGKAASAISSLAGKLRNEIGNAATAMVERAKTLVTDVVDKVKEIPGKIGKLGSDMITAGKDFIGKLFDGILEGARAAGGFVASLVESIKNAINSALNLPLTINFDKGPLHIHATIIPALAKGGIFDKATLALIGEAGKEVAIPLTNPARAAALAKESGLVDIPAVQRAFATNPATASPTARAFGRQPTAEAFSAALGGKVGTGANGTLEAAIEAQTKAIQDLVSAQRGLRPGRVIDQRNTIVVPGGNANAVVDRLAEWAER